MDNTQPSQQKTRIGFHYYPDGYHFRETDLSTWLPELQALAASWLMIQAPLNRAIPETFIRALLHNNIQPVLQLHFSPVNPPTAEDFNLLCRSYARWGVRYIVLFDRVNQKACWSSTAWATNNLVERFLDVFQPLALLAVQAGLIPAFPPLEPGGDYWDTAFLRSALEGLQRRNQSELLERMVLSCYAWSKSHPLNWGSGGPAHWPAARPYDTPRGTEDQRGFRIFDWYLALSEAVFGERLPILALAGGALPDEKTSDIPTIDPPIVTQNLLIARLLMGEKLALDPLPEELLAFNFWLLAASSDDSTTPEAWYTAEGTAKQSATALKQWAAAQHWSNVPFIMPTNPMSQKNGHHRPIAHYLLLAAPDEGISAWQMDVIRAYTNKYHPTIGFSPAEAVHANKVTVIGEREKLPDSILDGLITAGCQVEDLRGDGMTIATRIKAS